MKEIDQRLTVFVAILAALASAAGLAFPGAYADAETIRIAWRANDLVTLCLAPLLLITVFRKESRDDATDLLRLGLLLYMFYNYCFYLFGAVFNHFFIFYAALVTLSLYALLAGLAAINMRAVRGSPAPRRQAIPIALFFLSVALPLASIELKEYVDFVVNGRQPRIPTLVMELDLTLVVPNLLLAAVLLLRNNPWGRTLGAVMLVKSFTYGLVLLLGAVFISSKKAGPWDPLMPFYVFVSAGGFIFLSILLKKKKAPLAAQTEFK